ncbi:MAG TPA: toll/interleukin-1 receptor domain-containing protein [Silvibacterium sp.]|jgi:DNA-binding transcriptional MerR regulator|nr:toll/interleukin-1 receptor domain-containing protein [Silvibacterium sp.]
MADISKAFFSYSRHDSEFALKLAKDLRSEGAAVWLDQLDISPGQHWDTAIEKAVNNSSVLLVILSPNSVESENVMDEVTYALEERKLVIPVLYRECKVPLRLRRMQYIDVRTDYGNGLKEILKMLQVEQQAPNNSTEQEAAAAKAEQERAEADAANQARQRAQAEQAAQVQAARERVAREDAERRERERLAQQVREREAMAARQRVVADVSNTAKVPPKTRRIFWAAGGVAVFVVCGIIWTIAGGKRQNSQNSYVPQATEPSSSSTPNTEAAGTPVKTQDVAPASTISTRADAPSPPPGETARPDLAQWLTEFVETTQGPSVERLHLFFDETVSPYYTLESASWADVAKDKQAYFARFPQIQYQLVSSRHTPQADGTEEIEYDLHYSEVRKDGKVANGLSYEWAKVRLEDGRWKIMGIRERSP